MPGQPHDAVVQYPGGIRVRYRWAGSGEGEAVFALSEAGGSLADLGDLVSEAPDRLCRAEVRADTPAGAWTVRLASVIYDEPAAVLWDEPGLLVVRYGFVAYALAARTGELRWAHTSRTPLVDVLASPRLPHVLVQSEIETFAVDANGEVAWRLGHSDVVAAADLVGGRLVLTSYDGQVTALDPATGRAAPLGTARG
ncbi:MAG TPA: PQQ-binding-like beta-propeller repeat protein [Candidatus Limnocylindrales bacterium]